MSGVLSIIWVYIDNSLDMQTTCECSIQIHCPWQSANYHQITRELSTLHAQCVFVYANNCVIHIRRTVNIRLVFPTEHNYHSSFCIFQQDNKQAYSITQHVHARFYIFRCQHQNQHLHVYVQKPTCAQKQCFLPYRQCMCTEIITVKYVCQHDNACGLIKSRPHDRTTALAYTADHCCKEEDRKVDRLQLGLGLECGCRPTVQHCGLLLVRPDALSKLHPRCR